MKALPLSLILVFLSLFGASAGFAAQPLPAPHGAVVFRSYGVDQGLTTPSITAMAQDPDGFFWVGTEDGLFRQEGDKFRRFGEAEGLPSSRIASNGLASGLKRGLWVSTSRGLVFWDGRAFHRPSSMGMAGLDERPSVCMAQGGAILSDKPGGRRYLGLDGHDFVPLEGLPWGMGLTGCTFRQDQDLLLMALGQDLWIRHKGAWTRRDLSALRQEIRTMWVDDQGRIWIRCDERLARLEHMNAPLQVLATPIPLASVSGCNVGMDAFGRFWTNAPQGIVWIEGADAGAIGPKDGLPQGGAVVLCVDQQSNLWIGGEGCQKLLGQGLWTGWTRHQGLPTDVVWTVTRTRDGLLWAGTAAGLAVGDARGWKVLPGTHGNQFSALEEDADGNLWAGHQPSQERPFALSVRPKGRMELLPVPIPGLPPRSSVSALLAEGETLWVGTGSIGLLKGARRSSSLRFESVAIGQWPKETSVQRIIRDDKGGLWVAGFSGVAHWDGTSWATIDKATGLLDNSVITMAAMTGGEVWAGYAEVHGLSRLRRNGTRLEVLESLQSPHPLVSAPIVTLFSRGDGLLWLGTSRGVMRWDGRRIERFGRHTGLPGEDCAQNGLWFDPSGDLWVGLSVGLARGRIGLLNGAQFPPSARIFEAQRGDGKSFLAEAGERFVPWAYRTLTFQYGPEGTLRTEDLSYQVRMVGLEDHWRNTALPEARYPGLGAGEYRFEVRTVNSTGETGPVRSVEVRVQAPWWQRPWFLGLVTIVLGGCIFLAVQWRLRLLQRRNAQLEALVQARTQELEAANQSLLEASLIDPLTGLHNRRYLTMTMPEEEVRLHRMFRLYLQRGESPLERNEDLVLFMGDLDHFKQVNDTYGHAAGDLVLQETARRLRGVCRTSDTLVRWGGEEFLLVAKRSDRTKAHLIAEKLCQSIRATPFVLGDGRTLNCSLSVGFAAFPILDHKPEIFSWEDTLQGADQCLYAAKHAGRDGWVGVHTPGPVDPAEMAPRFRMDLEGLVKEGKILVSSSFPEGRAFA